MKFESLEEVMGVEGSKREQSFSMEGMQQYTPNKRQSKEEGSCL
jgi:hypothetical protein